MSKKVLGRGLAALLPQTQNLPEYREVPSEKLQFFKLDQLAPNPLQPRTDFPPETLQELAQSIRSKGILQPLVVSRGDREKWHIIIGERRWRAARMAGLKEVPALVVEISPLESVETALVENLQRENLNPLEEACAYHFLIDEHKHTQEELASRVGKSRSYVANSLRLLALSEEIKEDLRKGVLTAGHARAALSIGEEAARAEFWREVKQQHLSVRQAEKLAKIFLQPKLQRPRMIPPEIDELAGKITEKIGQKVKIQINPKGKGKLVIHFSDLDNLARLVETVFTGELYEFGED